MAANLPPEECELLHLLATPLSIYLSFEIGSLLSSSASAGSMAKREGGGSNSGFDQSAPPVTVAVKENNTRVVIRRFL